MKRDQTCLSVSGSSYTYESVAFNITCSTSFSYVNEQAAEIVYAESGLACLQACVNFNSLSPCTAIQYDESRQGAGPDGGFLCYLLWSENATEQSPTPNVHIAQVTNEKTVTVSTSHA